MNLATVLVLLTALVGCTTPEAYQRHEIVRHRQYLEDQAALITVDPSDGISEVEAYRIGRDRFGTYQTACGVVSTPVDLGNYWRVTTCPGLAGRPFEDILIRKSDGLTTIKKAEMPNHGMRRTGASGSDHLAADYTYEN